MLYVIYGNDREQGRQAFQVLREKLLESATEERVLIEGEVTGELLDALAVSQGLFGETTLAIFDSVLEKKGEQELLASRAESLTSSSNHFLVFEPTLEKSIAKEVALHATQMDECTAQKIAARPSFNIFALGDALGGRNKKELWVLYQGALRAGLELEEIVGTLFWAVKNMALMKHAKMEESVGLNPFVAKKARGFAANYSEEEIKNLSRDLATIYHEAHRGGESMDIALERFILSL